MVAKVSIAPGFEQHFFISYSWAGAGKELARRLEQNLRHDGYAVWVDVNRMSGNINDAMAEGINTSMVFIPIMDIHYGKSKNCKKELNYASDIGKAIVPIRLTNQIPDGEKLIIAGLLHFELDSRLWRPSYLKLLKELEKILSDVTTVPSPRVALSISNVAQQRDLSATKSTPRSVIGSAVPKEAHVRSLAPTKPKSRGVNFGGTSSRSLVPRAAQKSNPTLTKTASDASVPRWGESELIRNLEQRGIDFSLQPAFIPVSDISCKARVVNLVSIVNLQHTFCNKTEETLTECVYLFTVPENANASVCGFYAEVAGRVLKGVVKEKAEAQQEYTNARDKGTVSALIGIDVNPGQFRVSIGNLPGGAAATMHITFIMEVSSSSENIRIAFPTQRPTALESKPAVVGTDTKLQVEVGVELLSGTIRALSSPSHRNVFVEMGKTVKLSHGPEALADAGASAFGETTVSCARATYSGRPSEDPLEIFVAVDPGSKPAGVIELDETRGTSVGMLALTLDPPPPDLYRTEVLVIIDCGLFMRGEPLQMAVQLALRALQSAYAGLVLFFGEKVDRSSLKSIQSPFASAKKYLDDIDAVLQRCGSGDKRELLPAMHAVLESRFSYVKDMQTVILVLSDGKFSNLANVAATIPRLVAGATNQHFTVCTLGVGDDVSRPALELLAQVGNGVCDFVKNSDFETDRAWDTLASVVSVPWTRVQVIWPFASQHTIGMMPTSRLGCLALSSMQEKSTMGGCAATSAVLTLGTEAKVLIPLKPLSDTFAHTIAAQKRIRELESLRKDAGRHDTVYAQEIARLGIAYQLASSQTSFVAIWDGTDDSVTHIDCNVELNAIKLNAEKERHEAHNQCVINEPECGQQYAAYYVHNITCEDSLNTLEQNVQQQHGQPNGKYYQGGFSKFFNKLSGEDSLNNLQQNVQQQQGQPNGKFYHGQPSPAAGQPQYGQQYPNATYYDQQVFAQAQYNEALRQQRLYQQYLQQQQYAKQWASFQHQQQLQRPVPMCAFPWTQAQMQVPQQQPQQGIAGWWGLSMEEPENQAEGLSNIKYVVGIDFGTTFSGFSVLAVPKDGSNPTKPAVWTNWGDQPPHFASPKTPTLLAYSKTQDGAELRHWGWTVDAVTPRPNIRRIERVKLLLRDDHDVSSSKEQAPGSPTNPEQLAEQIGNMGIDGSDKAGQVSAEAMIFNNIRLPKGLTPTQVIGDYLRSMSEVIVHVVENITKTSGGGGQKIDLQKLQQEALLCFTVPVNWTPGGMEVMRKAAQHAGLIEKAESPNLVFCHEPVAAVLTFAMKMMNVITPGSRALVVDAGGGTVDLFQCTFGRELEVTELTQAAGDFFGASLVDQLFWSFFETQIGPASYERLRQDSDLRQAYQDVLAKWDTMKREFNEEESTWTDESAGGYKPIVLPTSLCHAIRRDDPEYIAKLPNNGTEVRITLSDMKTFFDPAVNRIVEMVVTQLDAAGATAPGAATEGSETNAVGMPIDHLFLVGGFCSSGYLRRRMLTDSRVVGRVMNVPTIEQSESAVLEGAAWYGFDANMVRSRKARHTLGIKIERQYDLLLDSKADVVNPSDPPSSWIVYKKFCVFVQRNQTVEVGASFTRDKFILTKDMVAEVMVYGTVSETVPNDVTDPGCHIVGKFTLDTRMWMYAPEWNREDFSVTIEYGKIELWVCARPNLRFGVPYARMKELECKTPLIVQGEW